ncbi:APC family permease [Granulicella arctica]|uniref:Amino acid transporter n=1 Tax=Granulicella arctica TaxID=940613 RepID=A0A7Y9PI34_9BACT|nr:APC family permease [Granulicella arctica]NYF80318.1 amino acid transporter [Granulicella arctica]
MMSSQSEVLEGVLLGDLDTVTGAQTGLRHHVLSPMETLGQSISTIAPSTSPTMTIPLVFAVAGNGTWLAYLLATCSVYLVALCIRSFARDSASPGSLYVYATSTLPPAAGALTAWALLLAYIATGSSVIGGFVNYGMVVLETLTPWRHASVAVPVLLAVFVTVVSVWIAYRDVRISARLMLWIEGTSALLITIVLIAILVHDGFHFDIQQLELKGASVQGIRLGMVLALFSFVGFESATTLGAEAREPLRSIPRAVLQSAILCGLFFILAAYGETLGYRPTGQNLADTTAPFHLLSSRIGMPVFGPLVDIGVLVSMFAATLGCITAAARVLLLMSHNGLTHGALRKVHLRNQTPGLAVLVVGVLACLPAAWLSARGASGADIYGWMGSFATYGFITVYGLVAIALPIALHRKGQLRLAQLLLAAGAAAAMMLALEGSIYPVPPRPYSWLPYLYLSCLFIALGWFFFARYRSARMTA